MVPLQGIIILVATFVYQCQAEEATKTQNPQKREAYGLVSPNDFSYDLNNVNLLHSQATPQFQFNNHQQLVGQTQLVAYDLGANSVNQAHLFNGYQYGGEGVKRYAVKEDVDEGYVTTPRTVYAPRTFAPARPQNNPSNEWTPIVPDQQSNPGKAAFIPNLNVQNNIPPQFNLPVNDPLTQFKLSYEPIQNVVGVPVPQPYSVPVYQPYPVALPQPYPVEVPVPVEVQSTVALPVEKPVPYPVIKHVPYNIIKNEPVPVPLPYPVPVPVYKTKFVVHSKN